MATAFTNHSIHSVRARGLRRSTRSHGSSMRCEGGMTSTSLAQCRHSRTRALTPSRTHKRPQSSLMGCEGSMTTVIITSCAHSPAAHPHAHTDSHLRTHTNFHRRTHTHTHTLTRQLRRHARVVRQGRLLPLGAEYRSTPVGKVPDPVCYPDGPPVSTAQSTAASTAAGTRQRARSRRHEPIEIRTLAYS